MCEYASPFFYFYRGRTQNPEEVAVVCCGRLWAKEPTTLVVEKVVGARWSGKGVDGRESCRGNLLNAFLGCYVGQEKAIVTYFA